ncbi:MAG TPA: ribose-phosphate pyrophosphokinase-like domain-containing protein, partial [Prolixibacteraceae bacterium]|nr:ribose-phosphate pyrophosphokinase-like domain-containing protein [Prolixibacteraceae bacterium]
MGTKTHPIKVFSCRKTTYLAKEICNSMGIELGRTSCPVFSDGEFEPCYEETIRGCHVFIIQS